MGLSGTGPKAGGPQYLPRFRATPTPAGGTAWDKPADMAALAKALKSAPAGRPAPIRDMPGPTGESNRLGAHPRSPVLCLGPGQETATAQADAVRALGGVAVQADGLVAADSLTGLAPLGAVIWWGDAVQARNYEQALALRDGPIIALLTGQPDVAHVLHERHVCVDTTAAGGNAALLAEVGSS